jgi:hypothetical protein
MSADRDFENELEGELETSIHPDQRRVLYRVAERLERERPLPNPAFKGELRRKLAELGLAPRRWQPERLRLQVAAYLAAGLALLALAAIGLSGIGPFAS